MLQDGQRNIYRIHFHIIYNIIYSILMLSEEINCYRHSILCSCIWREAA